MKYKIVWQAPCARIGKVRIDVSTHFWSRRLRGDTHGEQVFQFLAFDDKYLDRESQLQIVYSSSLDRW